MYWSYGAHLDFLLSVSHGGIGAALHFFCFRSASALVALTGLIYDTVAGRCDLCDRIGAALAF